MSVISIFAFDRLATGFPVFAYVRYELARSALGMANGKAEHDDIELVHRRTISCLFDLCSGRREIRLGMVAGSLCPACYSALERLGATEAPLGAFAGILDHVALSRSQVTGLANRGPPWAPEMVSVLHLSDLHFGSAFRFRRKVIKVGDPPVLEPFGNLSDLSKLIGADLKRILGDRRLAPDCRALASRIDLVVVSGDLAQSGGRDKTLALRDGGPENEYDQAAEFITSLLREINIIREQEALSPLKPHERVITVPGNHDVNWDEKDDSPDRFHEYAKFWRRLTGSREYFDCPPHEIMVRRTLALNGTTLAIVGFNSCTVTGERPELREIGFVEDAQIAMCERFLEERGVKADRRIAVVHHHPVYIPALAAGQEHYDAILQAGKLLSYLQERRFDLILHGHRHYPMAWVHSMIPYEATHEQSRSEPVIVSSGSVSVDSQGLPSSVPNTYQLIGVRRKRDPVREVCVMIRRRLPRGDAPFGTGFEADCVALLGRDVLSDAERTTQRMHLAEVASPAGEGASLHRQRMHRYEESGGWMLVHRYARSQSPDQEYDISVYLVRKRDKEQRKPRPIARVKYAVGDAWRGSPFIVENPENGFELRLSAYGPFLCIAQVHFVDGGMCQLERFIDFEMATGSAV